MINKSLMKIIIGGRARRALRPQVEEDAVEAARTRSGAIRFPGDNDAPGTQGLRYSPPSRSYEKV